jgi:hypothetical protein
MVGHAAVVGVVVPRAAARGAAGGRRAQGGRGTGELEAGPRLPYGDQADQLRGRSALSFKKIYKS